MKTWKNTDKTKWPEGEWKSEPDKAQWISSNLDCLIVRNSSGNLCGYVGVPESHEHFKQGYGELDIDVHGGLTFASLCQPNAEGDHKGICHTESGAANKVVWWLGFDCAHCDDIIPLHDFTSGCDSTYKNFNYVKRQTESLAEQLSSSNTHS